MSSQDIQAVYGKIDSLIDQQRWAEAHKACLEILRFDPENLETIRLKNKIEREVKKINRKAIEDDLKKLEPLWKEQNYENLLINLKKLEVYINDYPELKKIIAKAENAYKDQKLQTLKVYYDQEIESIKKLLKENSYKEALAKSNSLLEFGLKASSVEKLITEIKTEWINYEIQRNGGLLGSEKYEDILLFYQGLLQIDPSSNKIQKLIKKTKIKFQDHKIEEKREFIYQGLEKIKTLILLKKYIKALEASEEILQIDPTNTQAKKYYNQAKSVTQSKQDDELISQMRMAQGQLKEDYKKNKSDYLKI